MRRRPAEPRVRAHALALAIVAGVLAGCAAAGLPQLPDARPTGSVAAHALRRAQESYLYPDRLDRRVMIGALDALEARFDSVRFDATEGEAFGTLSVGGDSAWVPLAEPLEPDEFDLVLARALLFVGERLGDEANQDEDSDLELIALRGALSALDRYSTVFSGRGTEDFQIRFSGKLRGIGARIGRRDGHLTAIRVFPESPADRAGLKDGDAILYIDGNPTRPLTVSEAVGQIRGPAGSVVVLTVMRDEERHEIEITRGEVVVPSVETRELAPRFGYARITNMSRTTVREFKDKVGALGPLDGLVLDLRGNTGGSMVAAKDIADLFLDEGVIVRIVDREGDALGTRSRAIAKPGALWGGRIVILVDPSTASAAEILSGAIEPLPGVTILGQTTFGKGLIQRVIPLPEERLLKLTVGEYLLSEDRAIHEKGIEPDLVLYPVSTENLGRLATVPEGALPYLRKPGEDDEFPIELALAMLRAGNSGRDEVSGSAETAIREALVEHGIAWAGADEEAPGRLTVRASSEGLVAGTENRLRLTVENPNGTDMRDVWAALQGPAEYLRNRLVSLGDIPAGGRAEGEIRVEPGEGLSADALSLKVLLASGTRPIQSEELVVPVQHRAPELEIEVEKSAEDSVRVTLHNRGCCHPGEIRVAVPGAVRSLEKLDPGAPETIELPITGGADSVSVLISGAAVQRRIDVPIPDGRVRVVPPLLELAHGKDGWRGRRRVEVRAQAAEGLREGWLALDGQKEVYVAWDGRPDGRLGAELDDEAKNLTTKIETTSGVSVIDSRQVD